MTDIIPKEKSPAFQFYPKDYLSNEDVQLLTLEQEGAYIRAMSYSWRNGSIPKEPDRLSALIGKGCTPAIAEAIARLFVPHADPTRLVHPRHLKEKQKQEEFHNKMSEFGKKGATARWHSTNSDGVGHSQAIARPMAFDGSPTPTSSSIIKNPLTPLGEPKSEPQKKKAPSWPPPGTEMRPLVFLTPDQCSKMNKAMSAKEFWYWISELSATAQQSPDKWKRKYKNHMLVVKQWRQRRLEDGKLWSELKGLYEKPGYQGTQSYRGHQDNGGTAARPQPKLIVGGPPKTLPRTPEQIEQHEQLKNQLLPNLTRAVGIPKVVQK